MNSEIKHIILETNNLSIGYSSKRTRTVVTDNINIKLNQGELIGLIGANGIGKSTLLRTITKVQKPLNGDVFINNINLVKYSSNSLAKTLSLVLTEQVASKNLSVFELVARS